jgi:hypothetical protein
MSSTTIAEAWDRHEAETGAAPTARRIFYAGALAAATSGLTREQLLAELVAYGRSVGTAAESAPGALGAVESRPWSLPGVRRRA